MRVIITGDKSRYQFLRSLIDIDDINMSESFYTEKMGERDIYVSSENIIKKEKNYFYSSLVPLNSYIYFPKEYGNKNTFCIDDRVIFFNEFPYNREDDMKRLHEIIDSGEYGQLCVVLVCNSRKGMDTDISSSESAVLSAKKMLEEIGITCCEYKMGEKPNFLFWKIDEKNRYEKQVMKPLLQRVKKELETFDSSYDLLYEIDVAMVVDDPVIRKNIYQYDSTFGNENIWQIYGRRTYQYLLKNNISIEQFYVNLYKNIISNIAIWDLKRDITDLKEIVKKSIDRKFKTIESICFTGENENYEMFLNRNGIIYELSRTLNTFFKEDLKKIVKTRITRDVEIMEELLDECNN